jgi:hypothetical protein
MWMKLHLGHWLVRVFTKLKIAGRELSHRSHHNALVGPLSFAEASADSSLFLLEISIRLVSQYRQAHNTAGRKERKRNEIQNNIKILFSELLRNRNPIQVRMIDRKSFLRPIL